MKKLVQMKVIQLMSELVQLAVPDPQLIRDAYTRQILVPMRENQQRLAVCIKAILSAGDTVSSTSTSSTKASVPIRPLGEIPVTAVAVTGGVSPLSMADATDLPSAIVLANANKAAINSMVSVINQVVTQQNALVIDRNTLVERAGQLQAQLLWLTRSVNQ